MKIKNRLFTAQQRIWLLRVKQPHGRDFSRSPLNLLLSVIYHIYDKLASVTTTLAYTIARRPDSLVPMNYPTPTGLPHSEYTNDYLA